MKMQNIRKEQPVGLMPNAEPESIKRKLANIMPKTAVVILFLCEFFVLLFPDVQLITGPIFTVLSVYLMFTDYFYVPFTVIIIPMGALGTIIAGKLAIYYLLYPLLLIRLFASGFKLKIKATDFLIIVIGAIHIAELVIVEDYTNTAKLLYVSATIFWFFYLKCISRENRAYLNNAFTSLAMSITANAFASILSGSYSKYATADRLGIAGVGGGNPNFAAFYIGIAIAIILSTKKFKIFVKLPILLVLGFALITTVSLSGLIGVVVVLLSYFTFANKDKHKLAILLAVLLAAVLAVTLFPLLNIQSESSSNSTNYLEYYQDKLSERLDSFKNQNYDDVTSNRTSVLKDNLEFFSDQSVMHQLFGGNSVNPYNYLVSHNSYADILMRFGYAGLLAILLAVIYRFYRQLLYARKSGDCIILMCKIALLFWSFTASMFEGIGSCLWIAVLLGF